MWIIIPILIFTLHIYNNLVTISNREVEEWSGSSACVEWRFGCWGWFSVGGRGDDLVLSDDELDEWGDYSELHLMSLGENSGHFLLVF